VGALGLGPYPSMVVVRNMFHIRCKAGGAIKIGRTLRIRDTDYCKSRKGTHGGKVCVVVKKEPGILGWDAIVCMITEPVFPQKRFGHVD